MPNLFNPIDPSTSQSNAMAQINNNFAKLDQEVVTKVFRGESGDDVIIGKLPNGMYGMLFYLNGTPHIIITATTGMVAAEPGTDVLTLI